MFYPALAFRRRFRQGGQPRGSEAMRRRTYEEEMVEFSLRGSGRAAYFTPRLRRSSARAPPAINDRPQGSGTSSSA